MDLDYLEWRNHHQHHQQPPAKVSAFPLFAPEEPSTKRRTTSSTKGMVSMFSLAQWQELELQALIYKYLMAGASVPIELILHLKRSLVTSSPYYQYHHFQPSMTQMGYWGRCLVDPEPGRCRRTDGKKWRCSRDIVAGHKYCDRHVHRGRNRSRKHVEVPTPTTYSSSGFKATPDLLSATLQPKKETNFGLSGPSTTLDILPLNQRPPDIETADRCLRQRSCLNFGPQPPLQAERTDSRVLMRFLNDWPRSEQDCDTSDNSRSAADTHLSISITENTSSDFSLKLSTGNTDTHVHGTEEETGDGREQALLANWSGWGNHGEASMGGPLAEALRSSIPTPSPTSILQKPNPSETEATSASA